jgi:5'-deoxynucleotidase YfbR-like HD superfamily hydrolase
MINEMLKKVYIRLNFFTRYRDTPANQKESIAEHQYFVCLITKILADKYGLSDADKLRALEIAMIHDIAESYSDDFVFPMKYSKEEFRDALEMIEDGIMKEISEHLDFKDLDERYAEYKVRTSLPALVVKLADWYSVLLFCEAELVRGENQAVRQIYDKAKIRTETLRKTVEAKINGGE